MKELLLHRIEAYPERIKLFEFCADLAIKFPELFKLEYSELNFHLYIKKARYISKGRWELVASSSAI